MFHDANIFWQIQTSGTKRQYQCHGQVPDAMILSSVITMYDGAVTHA